MDQAITLLDDGRALLLDLWVVLWTLVCVDVVSVKFLVLSTH